MNTWFFLIVVMVASCVLTGLIRRYALNKDLMDIPNYRSSHTVPTPRGGGVAIVLVFMCALTFLAALGYVSLVDFSVFIVPATIVASIGFLDDHGHVAARWRLLGHFVASSWAVFFLNGLPELSIVGLSLNLSWLGFLLASVYLVWMLNLYNFMDGIDGIASVEAICVCLGGAVLYILIADQSSVFLPLVLAGAVLGFLVWNFPPAKIFMGDAGSGFLGITVGILSIQASWVAPQLLWSWLILLGVFIVDATFTLLRRLLRGDKVYEAHRSHGYQYASRHYKQHLPVTLGVMVINLVWLFPLALIVALGFVDGFLGLLLAYAPLFFLAIKFKSGAPEAQNV